MRRVLFALMLGCGGTTASETTATLSGTLTLVEGDCMPQTSPVTCHVSHPSRIVYLFPLQYFDDQTSNVFPPKVDAAPVAQVMADSNGHYSMRAPPGRWSVFVDDPAGLYASSWDSTDGAVDAVTLAANVDTTYDVTINHATW